MPRIRYVKTPAGVNIAYAVLGEGPFDPDTWRLYRVNTA